MRSRRCERGGVRIIHWETGKVWMTMILEPEDLLAAYSLLNLRAMGK
ncbi:MAG: hypothetical protein HPY66_2204 [Firmicutes bacterium]|nr:hypothetical protein [Bacillota bacterium]